MKKYLYFYFVILKCYQTAIQYLGNVTLSLVVSSRHDKKLTRLGYHFVLRKVSALTGFWVHELRKVLNDILCDIKMQCE